jgi:lysophospholipase L1-like esterase
VVQFLNDTFTDADATSLLSHVGETGATWTRHMENALGDAIIGSNRVRGNTAGGGAGSFFFASGIPSGADYYVEATLSVQTLLSGSYTGVIGRCDPAARNFYWAIYNVASARYELWSNIAGTPAALGNFSATPSGTVVLRLEMVGTTIRVLVNGTQRISVTNSGVTAAGRAGLVLFQAMGASTGIHIDAITATDPSTALTAGTASVSSFGLTTATVTATAASAGTSPYTYQWYRSTTSGFTPGVGNIVSGATSLTLNNTGLTRGTTYYYKCVQADAVAASVTTNEISLTTRTSQIVAAGNSQTVGANGATSWATTLATYLGASWQMNNSAVSGQTTRDISTNYAAQVGSFYSAANTLNVVVIQEVMNDIYFGQTGSQAYNNLKTLCQSARATGFKVLVLLSQPDRNDFPGSSTISAPQRTNYQAAYTSFLTLFLADWYTFCDGFVNPFRDSRIVVSDGTYIQAGDLVHWTTATETLIAAHVLGGLEMALNPNTNTGGSGLVASIISTKGGLIIR